MFLNTWCYTEKKNKYPLEKTLVPTYKGFAKTLFYFTIRLKNVFNVNTAKHYYPLIIKIKNITMRLKLQYVVCFVIYLLKKVK